MMVMIMVMILRRRRLQYYLHPNDDDAWYVSGRLYCNATFDGWGCWLPTPAGTVATIPCTDTIFRFHTRPGGKVSCHALLSSSACCPFVSLPCTDIIIRYHVRPDANVSCIVPSHLYCVSSLCFFALHRHHHSLPRPPLWQRLP